MDGWISKGGEVRARGRKTYGGCSVEGEGLFARSVAVHHIDVVEFEVGGPCAKGGSQIVGRDLILR